MPDLTFAEYVKLVVPVITTTGGVTVAAVKYALNGSKKQITEIHSDVKEVKRDVTGMDKRLVRVETWIEREDP